MSDNEFRSFGIDERVLSGIEKMGFTEPTKVQKQVIPKVLEGKDVIVLSKTGSGKTAAFAIPVVNRLLGTDSKPKLRCIVLTPTRELALQVGDDFKNIAKNTGLKTTCVYGQHSMNEELNDIDRGVDILSGTPGRVLDHLQSGNLDLSDVEFFVLDEADRMLAMGFIEQVESILKYVPKKRNTMLFSATMPFEIMNICWQYMIEPLEIKIESDTKTVDNIKQLYYTVFPNEKRTALYKLISLYRPESLLVFCNTRWQVDRITSFLSDKGFSVRGIHGGISQSGRTKTMKSFKSGVNDILVATDVAARGIHVEDLEMVINYDLPVEKDNYVHRIGRTGRIGKNGLAVSLVTSEDMYTLYEIEEHIGAMISSAEFPDEAKMHECYALTKKAYGLKPPAKSAKARARNNKDAIYSKSKHSKGYGNETRRGSKKFIKDAKAHTKKNTKKYNKSQTDTGGAKKDFVFVFNADVEDTAKSVGTVSTAKAKSGRRKNTSNTQRQKRHSRHPAKKHRANSDAPLSETDSFVIKSKPVDATPEKKESFFSKLFSKIKKK